MKFDKIWTMFERVIYHNMKIFFTIFCRTYRLDHQCYDAEIFLSYLPYSKKLWRSKSWAKRATARHWRKKIWQKSMCRFSAIN